MFNLAFLAHLTDDDGASLHHVILAGTLVEAKEFLAIYVESKNFMADEDDWYNVELVEYAPTDGVLEPSGRHKYGLTMAAGAVVERPWRN